METLGVPMAYADSAMWLSRVSLSPPRFSRRYSSGRATKRRFPVQALQRERARPTPFPVIAPCSPNNEQFCLQGSSVSRIERLPSESSSQSRLDFEQMMWRMVRADKEPSEKDAGDEPDKTNDSNHQLWINRARNVQTTAHIFCSTMFWIVLFFISCLWDGDDGLRNPRRGRGRRRVLHSRMEMCTPMGQCPLMKLRSPFKEICGLLLVGSQTDVKNRGAGVIRKLLDEENGKMHTPE